MTALKTTNEALSFVDNAQKFLDKLSNYKPEVKSLRINYLDKSTEMKLLIKVPKGIKRRFRDIEIPAHQKYTIKEVYDSAFSKINVCPKLQNNSWLIDTKQLNTSDIYFFILEGQIEDTALQALVKLYCPADPARTNIEDRYWINSAIKDMSILEKIYNELTIDRVSTCVNVGLERQFSASMPNEMKEWLAAKAVADMYSGSMDREKLHRSQLRLRIAQRNMGQFSPSKLFDVVKQAASQDHFMSYVSVDKPFKITQICQTEASKGYPEKVGITVQTDLNYKNPVAQGDLIFKKQDFELNIIQDIQKLPGFDKLKRKLRNSNS